MLRSNPTGTTLMLNCRATWCGPCRIEYPELLGTLPDARAPMRETRTIGATESLRSRNPSSCVLASPHDGALIA